jgi:hypothetical protein
MPATDAMTIDERYKYLRRMSETYQKANRSERSRLLDHMTVATGLHRRSLVRLLQPGGLERTPRRHQRGKTYGAAVDDVIRIVWESLDYLCASRLTPVLLPTAQHLSGFGELRLTTELEEQLGRISRATVQRTLTRIGQDRPRLPQRGPDQANAVRKDVAMKRIPWDTLEPGHCETDLVHHCGPSAHGTYVHTLQMIDVATGWSERVAVMGRSQEAMESGFQRILERLPFVLVELHPDNDTAFFNHHLMRFFGTSVSGLTWTRSRPYEKNDNRFVEQKNDSLVRRYFGTARLDTRAQCERLNTLYEQMGTYYNLFQPVLHLVKKEVIDGRVRRQWDTAQTPYERLLAAGGMTTEVAERLATQYRTTNPRQLRRTIHTAIAALWEPGAMMSEVA